MAVRVVGDGGSVSHDEIEIAVKNVSIDDLREPPYRATADFEKVFYTQHDHLEIRRERYVAAIAGWLDLRARHQWGERKALTILVWLLHATAGKQPERGGRQDERQRPHERRPRSLRPVGSTCSRTRFSLAQASPP